MAAATTSEFIGLVQNIVGILIIIATGYYAVKGVKSKVVDKEKDNLIDVLLKSREEQKEELASLGEKHVKSQKDIANLQGQIDTLKTVPLKEISQILTDLKVGQDEISVRLDNLAGIIKK